MTYNFELDNRPNKEGLYRVYVRISQNGKKAREKTDVLISNKKLFRFTKYGKWVPIQEPDAININTKLDEILKRYKAQSLVLDDLYNELTTSRELITSLISSIVELSSTPSPFDIDLKKLSNSAHALQTKAVNTYIESFTKESLERSIYLKESLNSIKSEISILSPAFELLMQNVNEFNTGKAEYFKHFTESYSINARKLNKSPGYIRHVSSQAESFMRFAGYEIRLKDISSKTINDYIIHLSDSEKELKNNTIIDKVQRIGMILQSAADEGLIDRNPVQSAKLPSHSPVERHRLNDKQIKDIEDLQIDYTKDKYLFLARKMFLFSLYNAGIRIGDCIQLRFSNIINGRLEYQMGKTKLKKSILLSSKSKAIIDEMAALVPNEPINTIFGLLRPDQDYFLATDYESKKNLSFESKKRMYSDMDICAALIQRSLKDIATLIKHDKPLTFHISRHSFAEKARRAVKAGKATIFDIKSALGHQKIETTMKYLDSLDVDGLDSAMAAIFED